MGLCRLLLIVGLMASAAASNLAAQSNAATQLCDLGTITPTLARYSQYDPDVRSFLLSPTAQCFEALEASIPCHCRAAAGPRLITARLDAANSYCQGDTATGMCRAASLPTAECCMAVVPTVGLTGRPPYLCHVSAEPELAGARFNITGILELYAGACEGGHLLGVDECKHWQLPAIVLAHEGARPTAAVLAPTMAASASCTPMALAFSVVSYVLRDRTVHSCNDLVSSVYLGGGVPYLCHTAVQYFTFRAGLKATELLAIYNASGGLCLGGADHKPAAASCEGTIRTVSKDRAKPSPLLDSLKLTEIFRTWVVLGRYLAIMTVIFFWAAYKTSFFPVLITRKNFGKEERELKWAHAERTLHGLQLHVCNCSKHLNGIFAGLHVFTNIQGLTRFMMIIIILGVLHTAIRPVQSVHPPAPMFNVDLYFVEGHGYIKWTHDLNVLGTSGSEFELRRHGSIWKCLEEGTLQGQPPAWINATVRDKDEWSSFIYRTDNYYVSAYQNREVTHAFQEAIHLFPGSVDIGFASSYEGLNGGRKNLTSLNFNEINAKSDLRILSRYRHGVDNPFPMKVALTRYIIMFTEAQRFTEVDECIKAGWASDCYLQRPDALFVSFQPLSCGVLEEWNPSPGGENPRSLEWLRRRRRTYQKVLKNLGITEEEAPGLLRVMFMSPACKHNMKDVFPI